VFFYSAKEKIQAVMYIPQYKKCVWDNFAVLRKTLTGLEVIPFDTCTRKPVHSVPML
jgi:hypothetical protein